MSELEILTKDDAISVCKDNGTYVDYFLFGEYEIHLNKIKPHSKQEWHRHRKIEEVIVVTSGEILVRWMEGNKERSEKIKKASIVKVKASAHTIENISDEQAEFIVYRMVLMGKDNTSIIRDDKILIDKGQV